MHSLQLLVFLGSGHLRGFTLVSGVLLATDVVEEPKRSAVMESTPYTDRKCAQPVQRDHTVLISTPGLCCARLTTTQQEALSPVKTVTTGSIPFKVGVHAKLYLLASTSALIFTNSFA